MFTINCNRFNIKSNCPSKDWNNIKVNKEEDHGITPTKVLKRKSVVKNPNKIVDDVEVLVEMEEKKVKSVTKKLLPTCGHWNYVNEPINKKFKEKKLKFFILRAQKIWGYFAKSIKIT